MSALVCISCHERYPLTEPHWRCPCGGLLDIESDAVFPLDRIASRQPGIWRYREALPISRDDNIVSFSEGFTPLVETAFSGRKVLLKLDFLFPTGSFKDRGASVLVSRAKELGISSIVEDSSGNAGAAIAAYAAKAGMSCRIFVPSTTPKAKTLQIEAYGAVVTRIDGSRENTAAAALEAAGTAWYASHSWNPFFMQGTKTAAYELCEQLGWQMPDAVVAPVGNGTLLLGLHIGFRDLMSAGIAGKAPKLIGVQSVLCAPLFSAFRGEPYRQGIVKDMKTSAGGIAVAEPVRGMQIVEAVRESGGRIMTVEEYEITAAYRESARQGLFIEPTAAAGIAGLKKYLTDAPAGERIAAVVTGHGLKSV